MPDIISLRDMHCNALHGRGSVGGLPGVGQRLGPRARTGRSDFHRETVDRKRCSDCLCSSSNSLRKDMQPQIPDNTAEQSFTPL